MAQLWFRKQQIMVATDFKPTPSAGLFFTSHITYVCTAAMNNTPLGAMKSIQGEVHVFHPRSHFSDFSVLFVGNAPSAGEFRHIQGEWSLYFLGIGSRLGSAGCQKLTNFRSKARSEVGSPCQKIFWNTFSLKIAQISSKFGLTGSRMRPNLFLMTKTGAPWEFGRNPDPIPINNPNFPEGVTWDKLYGLPLG